MGKTSSVIGVIFVAATLAALSRTGAAGAPNKQHTCRNTLFQLENKSLEHGGSIYL